MINLKEIIDNLTPENKIIWERIFNWREVEITLNNLPDKYQQFEKQKIVFIQDKILEQEAIFNLSRQKRSQPQVKNQELETDDPLCQYRTETPVDELGRLENNSAITASNISKMADYHSLIIFKKHILQNLSDADFEEAFNLSQEWFEKIRKIDPEIKSQFLIWNYGYRSGASILHPHFQVLAYRHTPTKLMSIIEKLSRYQQNFQSNYFEDYFNLAKEMKIGQSQNDFKFWFSLTPPKEKGINFYGEPKARTLWLIIKNLIELGTENFNLFYLFKPLDIGSFGFFVDRGSSNKINSDFGSLEVFGLPVISSDPFALAKELFSRF